MHEGADEALRGVLALGTTARRARYEEYAIDELSTAYTVDGPLREWHLGRAQVFASLAQAAAVADLQDALSDREPAGPTPAM